MILFSTISYVPVFLVISSGWYTMLCVVVSPSKHAFNIPVLMATSKVGIMHWVLDYIALVKGITRRNGPHNDEYVIVSTGIYNAVNYWTSDSTELRNIIFSMLLDSNMYTVRDKTDGKGDVDDIILQATMESTELPPINIGSMLAGGSQIWESIDSDIQGWKFEEPCDNSTELKVTS